MKTTWVVVAESSRAKIYEWRRRSEGLDEIRDLVHPQSRQRPSELTSDLPGRSFSSVGGSRHAMEPTTDPKRHEAGSFAAEIAGELDHARATGRFEELVLVAPPRFLGQLRECLSRTTLDAVSREIHKNLTREDAASVRRAILEQS
ncbi:MAG: host attachment protein [Gammaproteobacteria bacterium]|nr:host attachment protein [Gammaproteobacteria bacterium]